MSILNSEKDLILIFFDLETTGLNFENDEVIEIAAIKTKNYNVVETFHSLIRPRKHIPTFISDLTNISAEEVENAPAAEEISEKVENFIGNYPLIAHNVSFDKIFLEKLLGKEIKNPVFDTLEISRFFFPELSSHSLQNLVKSLSLEKKDSHRALSDTLMLIDLFRKILNEKNKLPKNLLKQVKNILDGAKNYDIIFGNLWEETSFKDNFSLYFRIGQEKRYNLPFKETNLSKSIFENGAYFVEASSYESVLSEIEAVIEKSKVSISVYNEKTKDFLRNYFQKKNYLVASFENPERFICPKKLQFFIDNYALIPFEYRQFLATLIIYLYKTKDISIEYAPSHILKNPLLRILSFCDEKNGDCLFYDTCPLKSKINEIQEADIVVTEHQFILGDNHLKDAISGRPTVFFEAFRLPRVFFSARFGFTSSDIKLLASYEHIENASSKVDFIFNHAETNAKTDVFGAVKLIMELFKGHENDILQKFFSKETFFRESRDNSTVIFGANKSPKKLFPSIMKDSNPVIFVSQFNKFAGKNILKDFTGLEGKEITINNIVHNNTLSVIPLFLHSPNHDDFPEEFSRFIQKFHKDRAVALFNQNNLLKEIHYRMRSNGIKSRMRSSDSETGEGDVDLFMYDNSFELEYSEIYLIKTPIVKFENGFEDQYEILSMYMLKNILAEIINSGIGNCIIYYFDGRFKNIDFRTKYEDLFLSFPLLIEREDVLARILETHRKKSS